MKNIIVVDDEPIIAHGIASLISNFDLPINVVSVFTDSEDALEMCQSHHIDIVVTDINMPDLNGLDLIRKLKNINSNLQIIILTGFGSFSYAKEAMSLGINFFLEKPVIPSLLLEALQTTMEFARRRQVETELYQGKQIEQFLVTSDENFLPPCLKFPFHLYLFDSKFHEPVISLISTLEKYHSLIIGYHSKVCYIIENKTNESLSHSLKYQLRNSSLGKGVLILSKIDSPQQFLLKFQISKRHLDKDFYFDNFEIIEENKLFREKIYENQIYLNFREQLLQLLIQGEITACEKVIRNFFNTCRLQLYPVQLLRLQINDLLSTIFDLYTVKQDPFFNDYSPKIMLLNNWQELQFMLLHCMKLLRETLTHAENMNLSQKVNLIIEEYFDREELSLKWIACHLLYINPEYLGKIYYKETGIRFNKKLSDYRIKKAQDLLLENYKVYEVANLTGFGNSPEYFVQTFKKIIGMTPKQFVKEKRYSSSI